MAKAARTRETAAPGAGTLSDVHLALRGISHTYPARAGQGPVAALGPLDFEFRRGEFVAVVGPSGCGKSTLLEIIAGLVRPTAGAVEMDGRAITGTVADEIGVVFQEDATFAWLNVWDNVAFGLRRAGTAPAEVARRADYALAFMGLTDFRRAYPAQLSGGMRQRVCIARTLVFRPRLILLDEPFGALDQQTRLLMGEELLRLWRETAATVMLITHALDEAALLSDRVAVMSARPGRLIEVVATGWPRERDSALVADPAFGALTARLWALLRDEVEEGPGRVMTRVRLMQLGVVCGAILVLELLCRLGIIDRFTMIPPLEMLTALAQVVATAPWFWGDVGYTLGNLTAAIALSVVGGFLIGLAVHAVPRLRRALDPIFTSYYSVPTFVLYPLLIVVFGIGPTSLIVLGALFGIVAMIVATVTAIDRVPPVLLKVARVSRLGRVRTALLMKLPAASPHLVTGLRLAVAYSVIGIIAGEFILSTEGIGRRVALAYNNFDNQTIYALLVLILGFAIIVNAVLGSFEQALHRRWYRS